MKKFIAYIHQEGGCDYTIGCGNNLLKTEASNIEEAKQKFKEIIKEEYSSDETSLVSCKVYEVSLEENLNVNDIYNEIKSEQEEKEQRYRDQKDRAEYERLIKKFGDYKK